MSNRVANGAAIRAIREAKAEFRPEFRVSAFSITCLMSPAHLCNVEAGRRQLSPDAIERVAQALGVPLDAISHEVPTEAAA